MFISREKQSKCSSGYAWRSNSNKYIDYHLKTPGPLTVFFSEYEYKHNSGETKYSKAETILYKSKAISR